MFIKRTFFDKIYWLSVMAAIFLLLCSIVYKDTQTGMEYTFISILYEDALQDAFKSGQISVWNILLGYDSGYLWMFCPIIVGVPCVLNNRTERFVLFRTSKNKYLLMKYFSNLLASGVMILIAYLVYAICVMFAMHENIWDITLVEKFLSVFCWGVISSIPSIILSEFVHSKYLILCIPFVLNYFWVMFFLGLFPYDIRKYISPYDYQILFADETEMIVSRLVILAFLVIACAFFKKVCMERRCDCGQR